MNVPSVQTCGVCCGVNEDASNPCCENCTPKSVCRALPRMILWLIRKSVNMFVYTVLGGALAFVLFPCQLCICSCCCRRSSTFTACTRSGRFPSTAFWELQAMTTLCAMLLTIPRLLGLGDEWTPRWGWFAAAASLQVLTHAAIWQARRIGPGRVPEFLRLKPRFPRNEPDSDQRSPSVAAVGEQLITQEATAHSNGLSTPQTVNTSNPISDRTSAPKKMETSASSRGKLPQSVFDSRLKNHAAVIVSWVQTNTVERTGGGGLHWCSTCNHFVPDRAVHCRLCNQCSLGMVHHNEFISTCTVQSRHGL